MEFVSMDVSCFEECKRLAESGDASKQVELGDIYYNGDGVPKDDAEAVRWYRLSAEQGDAGAQYNLGNAYYTGQGVSKNYDEARKWWTKAAEQGVEAAEKNLLL